MTDNPNIPGAGDFHVVNNDLEIHGDLVIKASDGTVRIRLDRESGDIFVFNDDGEQVFRLEAEGGNLRVGGNGGDGDILVYRRNADNAGPARSAASHLSGNEGLLFVGGDTTNGKLVARDAEGRQTVFLEASQAQLVAGANGVSGRIFVQDGEERATFGVEGGSLRLGGAETEGKLEIRNTEGESTFNFRANGGGPGPEAMLDIGGNEVNGSCRILARDGVPYFHFSPSAVLELGKKDGTAPIGRLMLHGGQNSVGFSADGSGKIEAGGHLSGGQIRLSAPVENGPPNEVIIIDSNSATMRIGGGVGQGRAGKIDVRDAFDNTNIIIDGEEGDIRLPNADLAEEFSVVDGAELEPGTVVIAKSDGSVAPSSREYDCRVIGVIAGAGKLKPGVVLGHQSSTQATRLPVALAGTVYARVSAMTRQVRIGDPLTTSEVDGVAMVANDIERGPGSIIGKALDNLKTGQALIPILVAPR